MPKKKAPGPDGVTAELIQAGGIPAQEMTANIIQKIWETADIPHKLNKAYI